MDDNLMHELALPVAEEDIVLELERAPPMDPARAVEQELWDKYGLDIEFLKKYVDFALNRSARDVMQELVLMPPNTISRIEMELMVNECVDVLRRFERDAETRRAETKANVDALKSVAVSRADFDVKLAIIVSSYSNFMAQGWKARARLMHLAQQTPIDVRQYKQDMDRYIRVWTAARISVHFPAMGIAIL